MAETAAIQVSIRGQGTPFAVLIALLQTVEQVMENYPIWGREEQVAVLSAAADAVAAMHVFVTTSEGIFSQETKDESVLIAAGGTKPN